MSHGLHEELALMTKNGDMWAWHELCREYQPLLNRLAAKFVRRTKSMTFEDLLQEGRLALLLLAQNYQSGSGTKLSTWLINWSGSVIQRSIDNQDRIVYIPNAVCVTHRNTVRAGGDSILPGAVDLDSMPEGASSVTDRAQTAFNRVLLTEVIGYIDRLDERDQIIIKRHLFDEESMSAIGRDLDMSRQTTINTYTRAIKKLRKFMNEHNESCPDIWRYSKPEQTEDTD